MTEAPKKRRQVLTDVQKGQIIGAMKADKTIAEAAAIASCWPASAHRYWHRFLDTNDVSRKEGQGRKRKTTPQQDRAIIREVKKCRFVSTTDILNSYPDLNVSPDTISRRIKETGEFNSYWAAKKPYMSPENKRKRLAWAKEHLNWTIDQWANVLWSDESPFVLRYHGKQRVWRLHNERYDPKCTISTVKHDAKLMVWGCFAAHGVGRLHRVEGIMTKEQYHQILIHQMQPSGKDLFPDGKFIFQQDNDPKHTAHIIRNYFANKSKTGKMTKLVWPAQSPDLNPIENLWSELDRSLKTRKANSLEELMEILQEGWKNLSPTLLRNLVESMPRRCQAVIDAKGAATKY